MYKQAARIALDESIKRIASYGSKSTAINPEARHLLDGLKDTAITGINIAKRLLEESDTRPEIHAPKGTEEKPPFMSPICMTCGNEEFTPNAKYCKICGTMRPDLRKGE